MYICVHIFIHIYIHTQIYVYKSVNFYMTDVHIRILIDVVWIWFFLIEWVIPWIKCSRGWECYGQRCMFRWGSHLEPLSMFWRIWNISFFPNLRRRRQDEQRKTKKIGWLRLNDYASKRSSKRRAISTSANSAVKNALPKLSPLLA